MLTRHLSVCRIVDSRTLLISLTSEVQCMRPTNHVAVGSRWLFKGGFTTSVQLHPGLVCLNCEQEKRRAA